MEIFYITNADKLSTLRRELVSKYISNTLGLGEPIGLSHSDGHLLGIRLDVAAPDNLNGSVDTGTFNSTLDDTQTHGQSPTQRRIVLIHDHKFRLTNDQLPMLRSGFDSKSDRNQIVLIPIEPTFCPLSSTESDALSSAKNTHEILSILINDSINSIAMKNQSSDIKLTAILAKTCVLVTFLKQKHTSKLMLFETTDDDGIHLQYSYARLQGIKKYVDSIPGFHSIDSSINPLHTIKQFDGLIKTEIVPSELQTYLDSVFLTDPNTKESKILNSYLPSQSHKLLAHLALYTTTAKLIQKPSLQIAYTLRLAKLVSSLYYHMRVKGESKEVMSTRWGLWRVTRDVLGRCILDIGADLVDSI